MTIRVNGVEIETHETEYGVMFDDGFVVIFNDEEEARQNINEIGGELVIREVYMSAWAAVEL